MTTTSSILSVIQHYQRSIEKCQTDETRLLHCISKLYKLPVKVEHLQETGIGKTVNSLRKFDGEIGAAAKALVAKWKAMVAAEEEPVETTCNQTEEQKSNGKDDDSDVDHNDQNRNPEINNYNEQNLNVDARTKSSSSKELESTEDNPKSSKEREKHSSSGSHHRSSSSTHSTSSKHKSKSSHSTSGNDKEHRSREKEENRDHKHEKHRERDSNERRKEEKHKSSSSSQKSSKSRKEDSSNCNEESHHHSRKESHSSGKEGRQKRDNSHEPEKSSSTTPKSKDRKSQKDSVHEKHKSSSKEKSVHEKKSHHSSSTKEKEQLSTPASIPTSSTSSDRKRRHNSDRNSSDSKSPKAKHAKQNKPPPPEKEDGEDEEGIDSSMGANFADVLGMLNMPNKKSKKILNTSKSPNSNTNSSSQAKSSSGSKETQSRKSISSKYNGNASTSGASTSRNSEVKLDLLSSAAKLEPLDPSIALELPTISTNYKPMPLNKTVMDCVFASSSSSSYSNAPKAPVRTLTDAEALSHGISSKTMRTKIYSGVRTGQLMQVPSLFDLCIRILQKNIDALEYTGGVPFEVLRPVLERASPQQLLVFEEYNPYLMEDSDTLWQLHVQRHYRSQKRREMESWREMFLRCQDDQERKLNILAESIKQSQKIIAAPVRKTQLAFVDSMVKPPRNVQRKQEQYGTKSKLIATPAARVAALSSVTPNAAKTGDARLRVAASVRDHAQVSNVVRPKKAPLMAKTLQFMRGRHKR